MKLAALFSGGKDSTLAIHKAMTEQGHEVVRLVSIISDNPESYMYHTEDIRFVEVQGRAIGIPHVIRESEGIKEDELEDLKYALSGIRDEIDGVIVGAVESEYQASRVERICKDLGVEMVAPLWHADPESILRELVSGGFDARIIAVKAEGFDEGWLGRRIDDACIGDLIGLNEKYGIHLAGEGGEYETFVVDGPVFKKRVEIKKSRREWSGVSGTLVIGDVGLVDKH